MISISDIQKKYSGKIDFLDLELLLAHSLGKTREFVLTYPEQTLSKIQETKINKLVARRLTKEPVAYIIGHKEFYGLDFIINKHTLVPRPETEMIVEMAIADLQLTIYNLQQDTTLIDVGTGSGNIIISIAHELEKTKNSRVIPGLIRNPERSTNLDSRLHGNDRVKYFGIDISKEALRIAKKNAQINGVDKKIRFTRGSLLDPFFQNFCSKLIPSGTKFKIQNSTMIIVANLPYLSKEIYNSSPIDVKKYEPRSALYSPEKGLQHYRKLLKQVQKLLNTNKELSITIFLEISPEQKQFLTTIIRQILPLAKIEFTKDLAKKWRVCKISI